MKSAINPPVENSCHIGQWQYNPVDGNLHSATTQVRLQPRLATLLSVFVANSGVLLGRQTLIEILWPEKTVNEDALSRCVAELRAALGDNSSSPRYIETVPKRGYRFIQQPETKPVKASTIEEKAVTEKLTSHLIKDNKARLVSAIVLITIVLTFGYRFIFNPNTSENHLSTDEIPDKQYQPDEQYQPAETLAHRLKSGIAAATRITADTQVEYQPVLSSSGGKVAYTVMQSERLVVKINDTQGKLIHEIKDPVWEYSSPVFSPDDKRLLVAGSNTQLMHSNCTIFIYQLPSLQKTALNHCHTPDISTIFDWSSDGKSFAYVARSEKNVARSNAKNTSKNARTPNQSNSNQSSSNQSSSSQSTSIWIYNFETQQSVQVTSPTSLNDFDTRPRYSRNGKQLGFTRGSPSVRNIYRLVINTPKKVKAVTRGQGFISSFNWLNNDSHLLYDSNETGDRNLWLYDIKNDKKQILGARNAQYPTINTAETRLVFQDIRYNANIWQVSLSNKINQPIPLIQSIKYNNFPAWSPDGKQVAFVSNRFGRGEIWLYSTTSKKQTQLFSLPDKELILPVWSEDGSRMLVTARGGASHYQCYEFDVSHKKYQLLFPDAPAHYGCIYSSGGEIIAISKNTSEVSRLLKFDTDGHIKPLTDFGVSQIALSKFNTIIYSRTDKDGLYSMSVDGNNKKILVRDFNHKLQGNWTIQGSHLYYLKLNKKRAIWRHNMVTGEEVFVTTELPSAIGHTLTVNPAQSLLLMSRTDSKESSLYLSNIK